MSNSLPDPNLPLCDRLAKMAVEAREKARQLPPGRERDVLLIEARRAETAAYLLDRVSAPSPQSPR